MNEPVWKRLVESLDERGFESRYLDRLMDRLSPDAVRVAMSRGYGALEREIIEEMAYALRRTEDKLNLALLHVDLAQEALDSNTDDARWDELEDAYEERRRLAFRARWEFSVHREALGMVRHDVLVELYPIPRRRERRHAKACAASGR